MTNARVAIHLVNGQRIDLELFPDKAPQTVSNFICLAKKRFIQRALDNILLKNIVVVTFGMIYESPFKLEFPSRQVFEEAYQQIMKERG